MYKSKQNICNQRLCTCDSVSCQDFPTVPEGNVTLGTDGSVSMVTIQCGLGSTLQGESHIQCGEEGTWQFSSLPSCGKHGLYIHSVLIYWGELYSQFILCLK